MPFKQALHTALREPLVHFLLLGALIFGVDALTGESAEHTETRLDITAADLERIRALHALQWGAPPADSALPALLDDYIRQEILFREGVSLGFDQGDPVVRNRVVQKMEFLLQAPELLTEPAEDQLAAYFAAHKDRYRAPPQVSFTHIYFSPSQRGSRAETDAKATLAKLASTHETAISERGDPFIIPIDPSPRTQEEIERDFGADFAAALAEAPEGAWSGPLRSALGLHLVRVLAHVPAREPELADVRDQVRADHLAQQQRDAADAGFARIKARYQVNIAPQIAPASK